MPFIVENGGMLDETHGKLEAAILATSSMYERLVLLVGKSGSGKTTQLQRISKQHSSPVLNVSQLLSEAILELPKRQRVLTAPRHFAALLPAHSDRPAILDNVELMFSADLKMDPLACLRQASRHCSIVASFPGSYSDGHLLYAEPGHPEYRRFVADDLQVVTLSSPL